MPPVDLALALVISSVAPGSKLSTLALWAIPPSARTREWPAPTDEIYAVMDWLAGG